MDKDRKAVTGYLVWLWSHTGKPVAQKWSPDTMAGETVARRKGSEGGKGEPRLPILAQWTLYDAEFDRPLNELAGKYPLPQKQKEL